MFRNLTIIVAILVLAACNSIPGENKAKLDSGKSSPTTEKPTKSDVKIISGTGDGILVELDRPAMLLYGKKIESDFSQLTSNARAELKLLLSQIANNKGVMSGSLTYVYLSKPGSGKMQVFIGIPVKTKFTNAEKSEFMEIPSSRYYKMQLEAEPGETLKQHLTMQQELENQNLPIHLPILEQFGESYNSNMAPVSKATLYYPVK